jgi:hypothetical protein
MSFEKTSTMESIDASRDDLYWEKWVRARAEWARARVFHSCCAHTCILRSKLFVLLRLDCHSDYSSRLHGYSVLQSQLHDYKKFV